MSLKTTLTNDLTVVMYHYVRDIMSSRYPGIRGLETTDFVEQLEFLNSEYNIVSMEQVIDFHSQGHSLPPKALLLTFDDGYAEHFSNVYPILKNFDVQGTFFIPAKAIQEHQVLDVNKIHFILATCSNPKQILDVLAEEISESQSEYELEPFKHYFQKHAVSNRFDTKEVIFIKRMLQHVLPEKLRSRIVEKLFNMFVGIPEGSLSRELYMHEYQLKEMIDGGMHIGCHGYDHYWWDKLPTDALEREIDLSIEFLSKLGVSKSNWTACYPYGSFSDGVVDVLAEKGCRLALTTNVAKANLGSDHRLLIPRFDTNDFPPTSQNYRKYL